MVLNIPGEDWDNYSEHGKLEYPLMHLQVALLVDPLRMIGKRYSTRENHWLVRIPLAVANAWVST